MEALARVHFSTPLACSASARARSNSKASPLIERIFKTCTSRGDSFSKPAGLMLPGVSKLWLRRRRRPKSSVCFSTNYVQLQNGVRDQIWSAEPGVLRSLETLDSLQVQTLQLAQVGHLICLKRAKVVYSRPRWVDPPLHILSTVAPHDSGRYTSLVMYRKSYASKASRLDLSA